MVFYMKKNLFIFLFFFFCINIGQKILNIPYKSFVFNDNNYLVSYQSHVEGLGWQDNKNDGEMSGSTGLAKRIEGIKISLGDIKYEGHIEYKSYVENVGFEDEYKKDGQLSGTTGEARRIESVRIKLSGEISDYYDIYYRVHVQSLGWLGWAKNDEIAGSNGYGYRLEAIEIKLLSKNDIIDNKKSPYISKMISYRSHIGNFGWQDYKYDGDISGIPLKNQIEGFELLSCNNIGSIEYKSYVQDNGWEEEYKKNGEISGTTGQGKRLEAIRVKLTGELDELYDIYYRVFVSGFGWLGWAKNDDMAGTINYSIPIQALEIKILEKNNNELDTSKKSLLTNFINYSSHVESIGWQKFVVGGEMSGTTGMAKRVEGIKVNVNGINSDIEYRTFVEGNGWQSYVKNGEVSGTTGAAKRIEAIQIRLSGEDASNYDIYYRVHVQNFGWLGWAKNDDKAGTIGYNYRIEAIEIKILDTDEKIDLGKSFFERKIFYKSHLSNIGWLDYNYDGELSGNYVNTVEAFNVNFNNFDYSGSVLYKSLINGFGWENKYKKNGELSGTTGKGRMIEAIQLKLDGDIEKYYDICYRVHVNPLGWLGWAKNGEYSGTSGYNYGIDGIQIFIIKKGDDYTFDDNKSYLFTTDGYFIISNGEKVLDSNGSTSLNRNKISLSNEKDSIYQIWKLTDLKNGFFKIKSSSNINNCLSVKNNRLLINKCNDNNSLWKLDDLSDGYFNFVNNNLYLHYHNNDLLMGNEKGRFKLISYDKVKKYQGIDISKWQGDIDFNNLALENPNFIIMRVGTGRNEYEKDSKFNEYYSSANYYDIPIGAYTYSFARNIEEAKKEADFTLKWLDGKRLDLPIFYDIENISQTILGKEVLTKIAETFCLKIMENGYHCGIYANKYFLKDYLDADYLSSKYPIWLAHWTGANNYNDALHDLNFRTDYSLTPYKYWQFSSLGTYRGITANTVDLDIGYYIFD